jgi:chromosome segregation ATPase
MSLSGAANKTTASAIDQEFESGVRLIRDAFTKKLAQKESEILHLKSEAARKDSLIASLQLQLSGTCEQLDGVERERQEMQRTVQKLSHFKQSVLDSFDGEQVADGSGRVQLLRDDYSPARSQVIGDVLAQFDQHSLYNTTAVTEKSSHHVEGDLTSTPKRNCHHHRYLHV